MTRSLIAAPACVALLCVLIPISMHAALVSYVESVPSDGQVMQGASYPCLFGVPSGSPGNSCAQGAAAWNAVPLAAGNPATGSITLSVAALQAVVGSAFDIAIDVNKTGAEPDHTLEQFEVRDGTNNLLYWTSGAQAMTLGKGAGSNGADGYLQGFDLTGVTGPVTFTASVGYSAGASAGSDFFYLVSRAGGGGGGSGTTHLPEPSTYVLTGVGLLLLLFWSSRLRTRRAES